ncbi:methylated-DNA--protein-cysteine methyltransferase, inducible [Zeugodacus cucurbitae]|uniref:methylated-DNA--protein-cysteine methyltransferase, inducible n=1 Tax=Zeugodacus cucurbitae TaxID=28588 RepID=UPI00059685C0|nr:methylated-DNA--protein-cysteine methyltransferase, inducible [Zeugodacus cucurbitae]
MLGTKQVVLKSFGNRKPVRISYGIIDSEFGDIVLGFLKDANDAICYLHFAKDEDKENKVNNSEASLQKRWPNALLVEDLDQARTLAARIFSEEEIKLNVMVSGTPFQEAVWSELLKIPSGQTCTYGDIANRIGKPNAVRAVGTAVGSNEISIVIPCHRVVSKNGDIKYGGGRTRKIHLLKYEYEKSLIGK